MKKVLLSSVQYFLQQLQHLHLTIHIAQNALIQNTTFRNGYRWRSKHTSSSNKLKVNAEAENDAAVVAAKQAFKHTDQVTFTAITLLNLKQLVLKHVM